MWRQAQISRALTRNKSSTCVTLLWHFRTSYPSEPMETQHVPASTALGSSVTLFPALLKIRNEDLERFTGTWCAEDHGRREREIIKKKHVIVRIRVDPPVRRRRVYGLRSSARVQAIRLVLELRRRLRQRLVADLLQPAVPCRRQRVQLSSGAANSIAAVDVLQRRTVVAVSG